jgi:catechol 2,3-dioxygenase-like lactoylglutathione lyase family enzyme
MGVEKLDHYAIRTTDVARSIKFYEDALGLKSGYRPPFQFPGAWLYAAPLPGEAAGKPIVHLAVIAADESAETGAFDHIAFTATGIAEMRARLTRHGIAFRERRVPDMALRQVFIHDPDGVKLELNYSHPDDLAE